MLTPSKMSKIISKSKKNIKEKSSSKISKIEKIYGRDFGVKGDKEISNYLKEIGYNSLSKILKND